MPAMIDRICERCSAPFKAPLAAVNRGAARFCGRSCAAHNAVQRLRETRPSLTERFWKYVVKRSGNECWTWTGAKRAGYGQLGGGGTPMHRAHRLSYEIHKGPIPKGMHVLHRCDNPECTNPDHLWLGTDADNNADRTSKGRGAKGERAAAAKLTDARVRKLRAMPELSIDERRALGREWGVDEHTIRLAQTGRTWKHLALPDDVRPSVDEAFDVAERRVAETG